MTLGSVAAVAAAVVFLADTDPPDPVANRESIRGVLAAPLGRQVCVTDDAATARVGEPVVVCAHDIHDAAAGLEEGDAVTGAAIAVELDPGSGASFRVWELLEPA